MGLSHEGRAQQAAEKHTTHPDALLLLLRDLLLMDPLGERLLLDVLLDPLGDLLLEALLPLRAIRSHQHHLPALKQRRV